MRKSLVLLRVAAAAVLLATSAFAENRGVTFTGIGFLDPTLTNRASVVMSMNPEGTAFIASSNFSGSNVAFWTPESGWGDPIGGISGFPRLSSGGTVMGNGIFPGSAPAYLWGGTWTGVLNGWDPVPAQPDYAPCGSSRLSFFDMGGEGDYATGLTWQSCTIARAFRWDKATNTTVSIGTLQNATSSRGNGITRDGSSIVGWVQPNPGYGGNRTGARWDNGAWSWLGNPTGEHPKSCVLTDKFCNANSNHATNGCPEYVDDGNCTGRGTCQNRGTCVSNICVGGLNAGNACTNNNGCPGACANGTNPGTSCTNDNVCAGTCTGPNAGATCTSAGACPDTQVCVANPDWNDDLYKGEAFDVTADGRYACGRQFNFVAKWNSGWRSNPDGTFTELVPPATWPYHMDPFGGISDNGMTIVGVAGTPLDGRVPMFWREGIGTVDMQLFLIAQGLDELYFWYLMQNNTVSADGTVIGGMGVNPDGKVEGYVVDISKLWVCHAPPGEPEMARTLGIELGSAADHLAHGDFLGTCEFQNSGALSRANDSRRELMERYKSVIGLNPYEGVERGSRSGQPLKTAPERKRAVREP